MLLRKTGEKEDRILLTDENGNTGAFQFLELLSLDGAEYAAIADLSDEVYVMEFREATGQSLEEFRSIDDDGLFDAVLSAFSEAFGDEL